MNPSPANSGTITAARDANGLWQALALPATKSQLSASRDRRIQVVLMRLEENTHGDLAIEELAKNVNLSPGRLAHLFKLEMNCSVQQYVTRLRLVAAQQHLESSFLSIKEIAAAVGFSSVKSFCASFKRATTTTPAEYRKRAESILAPARNIPE